MLSPPPPIHEAGKRFAGHDEKSEQAIFGIRAAKNQSNQVQSVTRKLESSVRTIEQIANNLKLQVLEQDSLIRSTVSSITKDYLNKYRVTDHDGDLQVSNTVASSDSQAEFFR